MISLYCNVYIYPAGHITYSTSFCCFQINAHVSPDTRWRIRLIVLKRHLLWSSCGQGPSCRLSFFFYLLLFLQFWRQQWGSGWSSGSEKAELPQSGGGSTCWPEGPLSATISVSLYERVMQPLCWSTTSGQRLFTLRFHSSEHLLENVFWCAGFRSYSMTRKI